MTNPQKHRYRATALQAVVSCGLLAWFLSRGDFRSDLAAVLRSADPAWVAAGFGLAGIAQFLCLVRWWMFVRIAGVGAGLAECTPIFFAGQFSNLFLPGGAGGDVVKVGVLAARGRDLGRSAVSVVMDRIAGLLSMVVVGSGLMLWQSDWLASSAVVAGLARGIGIYLAVLLALVVLSVFLSMRGVVSRLPAWWPWRARLLELSGVYLQGAVQWRRTCGAVGLSVVMLLTFFLTYYCAARAFGLSISPARFLALMPTVDILAGIPVSMGGLGVREGAFALLLGELTGTSRVTALSISLCGYLVSVIWALPGAFYWLAKRKEAA